ncbi:MAG TPA: RidA family protein [Acidimicrobiales bacterium]|nr:RidA family protein [Acidimicrobiales bacterium]
MVEHPFALDPLSGFPYSNVAVSGDLVAIASQVPFGEDHHLVGREFSVQAHQVFVNLRRCLRAAGCDFVDVIKVCGYLTDPGFVDQYNEIYRQYFSPPYPARTTIACQLVVPGMLVQVDAFARTPGSRS